MLLRMVQQGVPGLNALSHEESDPVSVGSECLWETGFFINVNYYFITISISDKTLSFFMFRFI